MTELEQLNADNALLREALSWSKAGFSKAASGHISHKFFEEHLESIEQALSRTPAESYEEVQRLREEVAKWKSLAEAGAKVAEVSQRRADRQAGVIAKLREEVAELKLIIQTDTGTESAVAAVQAENAKLRESITTQKAYYESVLQDGEKRIQAVTKQRDELALLCDEAKEYLVFVDSMAALSLVESMTKALASIKEQS